MFQSFLKLIIFLGAFFLCVYIDVSVKITENEINPLLTTINTDKCLSLFLGNKNNQQAVITPIGLEENLTAFKEIKIALIKEEANLEIKRILTTARAELNLNREEMKSLGIKRAETVGIEIPEKHDQILISTREIFSVKRSNIAVFRNQESYSYILKKPTFHLITDLKSTNKLIFKEIGKYPILLAKNENIITQINRQQNKTENAGGNIALQEISKEKEIEEIEKEDDEIEPDYVFANLSVPGVKYNLDLKVRNQLYGNQIAETEIKEISLEDSTNINDGNYALKEPDVAVPTIPETDITATRETAFEDEKIAMEQNYLTPDIKADEVHTKNDLLANIEPIIMETDIATSEMKTDENRYVEEPSEHGSAVINPILETGQVKEEIVAANEKEVAEDDKMNEPITIAAKNLNNNNDSTLVASNDISSLRIANNEISLSGNIIFPELFSGYSRGHVELFVFDHVGEDGYPDEYSNQVYSFILPDTKTRKMPFIFKGLPATNKKYYLIAEFCPKYFDEFKDTDNKKFLAKAENNPIVFTAGTQDINLEFNNILQNDNALHGRIQNNPLRKDSSNENDTALDKAEINLIGTNIKTYTNKEGYFELPLMKNEGLNFEVLGNGFYPMVFSTCKKNSLKFDLISESEINDYLDKMAEIKIFQDADKGIILGKIKSANSKKGIKVDLSYINVDGPFYFNEEGKLDPSLEEGTEDGRFIYFNVPEGNHILGPNSEEELPGAIVDVYAETVSYAEIDIDSTLNFDGIVRNAFNHDEAVVGAKITLIGAPNDDSAITDANGFFKINNLRAISDINSIEIVKKGFYTTRITGCFNNKIEIYIFPQDGVDDLLADNNISQNPANGLVMGSIMRGGSLNLDISEAPGSAIYYFDPEGNIDLDQKTIAPIDGNFIITNIPTGQKNVTAYDENGMVRNYFTIRSGGSIINSVVAY